MLRQTWQSFRARWAGSTDARAAGKDPSPETIEHEAPPQAVPVLWCLGKTQSGKSTILRYLTGLDQIQIGNGFQPCTKSTARLDFPTSDQPLMTFLDTRGLDEPAYDPAEDVAAFHQEADGLLVTCRLTDFATGRLRAVLGPIRQSRPRRPVLLVLTCLHEARPQEHHPSSYPWDLSVCPPEPTDDAPPEWIRLVREQWQLFQGLVDRIVLVDLTPPEEGIFPADYGGAELKTTLLELWPAAYREAMAEWLNAADPLRAARRSGTRRLLWRYAAWAATQAGLGLADLADLELLQNQLLHRLAQRWQAPDAVAEFLTKIPRRTATPLGMDPSTDRFAAWLGVEARSGWGSAARYAGQSTLALGQLFLDYLDHHQGTRSVPWDDAALQDRLAQSWNDAGQAWGAQP